MLKKSKWGSCSASCCCHFSTLRKMLFCPKTA
jgi:hypothetical protein